MANGRMRGQCLADHEQEAGCNAYDCDEAKIMARSSGIN